MADITDTLFLLHERLLDSSESLVLAEKGATVINEASNS